MATSPLSWVEEAIYIVLDPHAHIKRCGHRSCEIKTMRMLVFFDAICTRIPLQALGRKRTIRNSSTFYMWWDIRYLDIESKIYREVHHTYICIDSFNFMYKKSLFPNDTCIYIPVVLFPCVFVVGTRPPERYRSIDGDRTRETCKSRDLSSTLRSFPHATC